MELENKVMQYYDERENIEEEEEYCCGYPYVELPDFDQIAAYLHGAEMTDEMEYALEVLEMGLAKAAQRRR